MADDRCDTHQTVFITEFCACARIFAFLFAFCAKIVTAASVFARHDTVVPFDIVHSVLLKLVIHFSYYPLSYVFDVFFNTYIFVFYYTQSIIFFQCFFIAFWKIFYTFFSAKTADCAAAYIQPFSYSPAPLQPHELQSAVTVFLLPFRPFYCLRYLSRLSARALESNGLLRLSSLENKLFLPLYFIIRKKPENSTYFQAFFFFKFERRSLRRILRCIYPW